MAAAVTEEPDYTKYVFKFSDYTSDPRLLKYDDILQRLYAKILKNKRANLNKSAFELHKIITDLPYADYVTALTQVNPSAANDNNMKVILYCLLAKQYGFIPPVSDVGIWPPIEYPLTSVEEEASAPLPPPYKVPGYKFEDMIQSEVRVFRAILDESTDPNIRGKTIQEAYAYIAGNLDIIRAIPESKFKNFYKHEQLYGNTYLYSSQGYNNRFIGLMRGNSWLGFLNKLVYNSTYTEARGNPLYGTCVANNFSLVINRNQQVYVCLPHSTNMNHTLFIAAEMVPIANTAWIKFSESVTQAGLLPNSILLGDNVIQTFCRFQGYRLYDMPPPPILKALSHGVPLAMSDHVKKLYPEWTNKETLDVWLDKVMNKWRIDIDDLVVRVSAGICKPDNTINEDMYYMRDIPLVQLEVFYDTLKYIMDRRAGVPIPVAAPPPPAAAAPPPVASAAASAAPVVFYDRPSARIPQGGGRRKTHTKSKGMRKHHRTHKKQRGGATSMPLAYYQDGTQMRGTTAEATGVGLGAATNTMARSAIQQTGGRRGKQQMGGFSPSLMGPFVNNGLALTPVASFMAYKMLKGGPARRSASRTSRAHRGPRSTQKKRRVSRKH
jgi:hypothetical protein